MDKKSWIIVLLVVLLLGTAGYITTSEYRTALAVKEVDTFRQGVQTGYEQTILQLAQQVASCKQVPLFVGNQTINVIAVECLQTG
jgi:hypothetical protein